MSAMEQPQQPSAPQAAPQPVQPRKPSEPANSKAILGALAVVVVIAAGYFLFTKFSAYNTGVGDTDAPLAEDENAVKVVSTPLAGGKMQPPEGFPSSIPYEAGSITESTTTDFPEQGARQLAVTYVTAKSVAEAYSGLLRYITQEGYKVSEGAASSPVKTIFGNKGNAMLSVAVSSQAEGTLVQISYLVKSETSQ
jgi:hypothetical protein